MSILIDENTSVIVQGITGRDGSFHARTMLKGGTRLVAGITPGKGGQKVDEIPVYGSIKECQEEHRVDATVIFVPARFASGAVKEAVDAKVPLIVCITEGIPVLEMVDLYYLVKENGLRLIGPNCPGLISPGKCKIGIMPARIHRQGETGVISRSGTLTYEVVYNLTQNALGQSTCIGIGGDPDPGSSFNDLLTLFQEDPDTEAVVIIGEIGGEDEEAAAEYIKKSFSKPGTVLWNATAIIAAPNWSSIIRDGPKLPIIYSSSSAITSLKSEKPIPSKTSITSRDSANNWNSNAAKN